MAASKTRGHAVEVSTLSNDRESVIAQPNGTLREVDYGTPTFITTRSGRTRVNNSLISKADAAFTRVATNLRYGLATGRASDSLAKWSLPGGDITVSPVAASSVSAIASDATTSTYPNLYPNANLEVRSGTTGPSFDLVLKNPTAAPILSLVLHDPNNVLGGVGTAVAGGWQFPATLSDGSSVTIPAPLAYEQGQTPNPSTSAAATLTVTAIDATDYLLRETVTPQAMASLSYPIVLDPSIVDQGPAQQGSANIWDCQEFSSPTTGQTSSNDYGDTNYCNGSGGVTTGYSPTWYATSNYFGSPSTGVKGHVVFKPDLSPMFNAAPNVAVQSATLELYEQGSSGNNNYDVCASNFFGPGYGTTYNNDAGGTPHSPCISFWANGAGWSYPDVTSLVSSALAGGSSNYYGFVLKDDNETCCSQYGQFQGNSSSATGGNPVFVVNYTVPPSAPSSITTHSANIGTSGTTQIGMNWAAPANNGGGTIDGYYAFLFTCDNTQVDSSGVLSGTTGSWTSSKSYDPSQCYWGFAEAHNAAGWSALGGGGTGDTAYGYSQPPTLSTVSVSDRSLTGTVHYPSSGGPCNQCHSDGGAAVTKYLGFVYAAGTPEWPATPLADFFTANIGYLNDVTYNVSASAPAYNFADSKTDWVPTNGTPYQVELFPYNPSTNSITSGSSVGAAGYGLPATTAAFTTAGVPFGVGNLQVTTDEARLDVSWTAPPVQANGVPGNNGSPITGYVLVATPVGGGTAISATVGATTASTIDNLMDGTAYTVTVTAVNGAGSGQIVTLPGSATPARVVGDAGAAISQTITGLGQVNFNSLIDTGSDLNGPTLIGAASGVEADTGINAPLVNALDLSQLTTFQTASSSGGTSGGTSSPSTTGTDGLQQRDGTNPPDVNGAVGPNYAVEAVNTSLAVYSKASPAQLVHRATLQSLFGLAAGTYLTDPHVIYDPIGGGYGHFSLVVDGLHQWYVAVSATSDPTGGWNAYSVPMYNIGGRCGDYPEIGSSHYFTILSITVYGDPQCASSNVVDSQVIAIDTASLLSYSPNPGNSLWYNLHDQGSGDGYAFRVSPVNQYAAAPTGSYDDAYLLDCYSGGGSHITVWRIDAQRQTLKATRISTPRYQAPSNAAQPSDAGGVTLNNPVSSITNSFYNGYGAYVAIDSTLTSKSDGKRHDGVLALRVNTTRGNEGVTNSVALTDAPNSLIYPTYTGDSTSSGAGELTATDVGPNREATDIAVGIDYTGKLTSTTTALATSNAAMNSSCHPDSNNSCRFGDYSSIFPDPSYPNTYWAFDEYIGKIFNNGTTPGWKTRIGEYIHDA